jgi:hypothetical protein
MNTHTSINGGLLIAQGWQSGKPLGLALAAAKQLSAQGMDDATILTTLDAVRINPVAHLDHAQFAGLAQALIQTQPQLAADVRTSELRDVALPYPVWGKAGIDALAINQMDNAMRLPISVAGALMPDAHVGYGLPIGGVLATEEAVIPYAVGVDIACRMRHGHDLLLRNAINRDLGSSCRMKLAVQARPSTRAQVTLAIGMFVIRPVRRVQFARCKPLREQLCAAHVSQSSS